MSYTKQTWANGDVITAEKLSHMEDGIEDRGFSCEETETVLTEESVTTTLPEGGSFASSQLSYNELIDLDEIIVVFEGTEYVCPMVNALGSHAYGGVAQAGFDFTEYPFVIASSSQNGNGLLTPTAGTYNIKISTSEKTVTTTECFKKAVQMNSCFFVRVVFQDENFVSMDKTFNEIADASESMIPCFIVLEARSSGSPTQYRTLQMDGNRFSGFYGSSVFVSGADLGSTRVSINANGTVTKMTSTTTLNT